MESLNVISASLADNVINALKSSLPSYDYAKPGRAHSFYKTNWSVSEHVPQVGPKN